MKRDPGCRDLLPEILPESFLSCERNCLIIRTAAVADMTSKVHLSMPGQAHVVQVAPVAPRMMSVLVPTGVSEDERFTVTTPEGASLNDWWVALLYNTLDALFPDA